jgi:hypothetical protein
MSVTPREHRVPSEAGVTLAPMGLLSPPSEEMRAAARALIHDPGQAPMVSDRTTQLAVEKVHAELDAFEKRMCAEIDGQPPESHAREAFVQALAQRISSTRLALSVGEGDSPTAAAGDNSADVRGRGSRDR